jgi:ureidoglycolate lyase
MKTVRIKDIEEQDFCAFGTYAKLTPPEGLNLGKAPVDFYPDLVQLNVGNEEAAFSICAVAPRPAVIDVTERHKYCGEGILPLDGDVLIHVGPPSEEPAFEQFEVYRVPQGTMVTLSSGVWHHAPYTLSDKTVHTLIVLPQKTYKGDCLVREIGADEQIRICI